MTEKLYENDTMLKECTSVVTGSEALAKGNGIILDRTCFFPEGGGQLSDEGWLETEDGQRLRVTHVSETEGKILHHCQKTLPVGTAVQAVLDWDVRLDRMQQHYGEHMLAYSFWVLFGANNIGFHMSEHAVAINLDQEVTAKQADEAERYANNLIWQDRPFRAEVLPKEEADKLPLRKRNDNITGMVRIVSIEGADCCMCCGTQPKSTGMIGIIKINKLTKIKEGTRVEFLCGGRAFRDIHEKMQAISQAGNLLSTKEDKVPVAIEKLKNELAAAKEDLRKKSYMLLQPDIDIMLSAGKTDKQGHKLLAVISDSYDDSLAKLLLKRLLEEENAVVAIFYYDGNRIHYILARSADIDFDCRPFIKEANAIFNGKGGGKSELCQGSAGFTPTWQQQSQQLLTML